MDQIEKNRKGFSFEAMKSLALTVFYVFFLLLSVPYVRFFQDFIRNMKLLYIYNYVLYFLFVFLLLTILLNVFWKRRTSWIQLLSYGATVIVLLIGLKLVELPVERVHFIEYGLLVFLIFNAIRFQINNWSVYIWTFLISLSIGILDEWIQWYVPSRFGEIRDIQINLVAISFALFCLIFLIKPKILHQPASKNNIRGLFIAIMLISLELTGFIDCAQLGFQIKDHITGNFRSRYSSEQLLQKAAKTKSKHIELNFNLTQKSEFNSHINLQFLLNMWRKENYYRSEALNHAGARNRALKHKDYFTAYCENMILKKYFSPYYYGEKHPLKTNETMEMLQNLKENKLSPQQFWSKKNEILWTSLSKVNLWLIYFIFLILMIFLFKITLK